MKKALLTLMILLTFGVNCFAAWDPTKPVYDEYIYDDLIAIRANWDAIALGTDAALQITNAKVAASAAIVDTKLAQITTAGKVSGAALALLGSVPSGSTALPIAAGGTGQTTRQAALNALSATSLSGTTGQGLVSDGTNMALGYPASLTIASAATGDLLWFNGTAWVRLAPGTADYALVSNGAGSAPGYEQVNLATGVQGTLPPANMGTGTPSSSNYLRGDGSWQTVSTSPVFSNCQLFTSSGTWTKPAGASRVWVKVQGGGGGGGSGNDYPLTYGSGGGGGGYAEGYVDVTGNITVTVGTGGAGGATANSNGTAGGSSSFAGATTITATGGGAGIGGQDHNDYSVGAGGAGSGGQINIAGGNGRIRKFTSGNTYPATGGDGGASHSGYGGEGVPGSVAGHGYGGGGGGGYHSGRGGAGSAGFVMVCY